MKKILGLDLGSASIGWAVISEYEENGFPKINIDGLGCRIIPYEGTEGKDFAKGTGESRNSLRTQARTARKGYDRYQLRRKFLVKVLLANGLYPNDELRNLPKLKLWELRNIAVTQKISLHEFGRLLLWLNQKRGYKSSRSEANADKKETEYVTLVKSRHQFINENSLTIGQFFYKELSNDEFFRVKEKIFPREAYIEEFNAISKRQMIEYPTILTTELISKIRDEIIYYQRPLKSQKGLVSVCEFAGFWRKGNDGKEYFVGPKVAPKSSPLSQIVKIWESINNIKLSSSKGSDIEITMDQKHEIFEYLDNHEKLSLPELLKILKIKKEDCVANKQLSKGIQGNVTKHLIRKALGDSAKFDNLLALDFNVIEKEKQGYLYHKKTGEVIGSKPISEINPDIESQPLYKLWHTIYSIQDEDECSIALQKKFGLEEVDANKLAGIDFSKFGFGNKSTKVIRKILPYLMEGDSYYAAMCYAGYEHSDSMTKDENMSRKLLDYLKPVAKNSLRQPIVEKILNQMINVINALIYQYSEKDYTGTITKQFHFDEIRIELARELKQSKEERNETDKFMAKRQRENDAISKRLAEYGLRATRNNILKWRLFEEIDNDEKKLNALCIYCGQPISLVEAIKGTEIDIEHILPKSKLFDDSQSNKTLAHRHCNKDKNDRTSFDFMKSKPDHVFNDYLERVNSLYANNVINKSKRDKLLMTESKIPQDFIDRQLRETQYIAKKAKEILQAICNQVWSTSGTVTSELRHLWGWDEVTMNLQFEKYKAVGLTKMEEWESNFGKSKHQKEVIQGWTKRDDHRHHAIDALTIACTKQGFIQRFNTLSASKTREDMQFELDRRSIEFKEKLSLLEKYIVSQQPIPVKDVEKAVANILVSFKSGKKVAVKGTRKIGKRGNKKIIQTGIIVPRGALSEQFVYGKIKSIEAKRPIKYLFENPDLIFKPYIRRLIEDRIRQFEGDIKAAIASLKKAPIYIDKDSSVLLEYATCFKEEVVKKYEIDINFNKVEKVIDKKVKEILQRRLDKFGGKAKEAFKDVQFEDKRIIKWYDDEGLSRPIKSVRCFTGLSSIVPVKRDESGKEIGFVKPGNNHHIAIYIDEFGNSIEHICTFWHAVERKKYGLPVIIQNPSQVWDIIEKSKDGAFPESFLEQLPQLNWELKLSMQQNEMFILGLDEDDFKMAINANDKSFLSKHLYLVWSISESDYWFRHHLETKNAEIKSIEGARESKRFYRTQSLGAFNSLNPIKVKIDCLGNISI